MISSVVYYEPSCSDVLRVSFRDHVCTLQSGPPHGITGSQGVSMCGFLELYKFFKVDVPI